MVRLGESDRSGDIGLVDDHAETETVVKRRSVFSDEFVADVRAYTVRYPDETRIGDLRVPPAKISTAKQRIAHGFLADCTPPNGWREFYTGLDDFEMKVFSVILRRAMTAGLATIGDVRGSSVKSMVAVKEKNRYGKVRPIISQREAVFLKQIFEKPRVSLQRSLLK